jgi:hypothetical protein
MKLRDRALPGEGKALGSILSPAKNREKVTRMALQKVYTKQ